MRAHAVACAGPGARQGARRRVADGSRVGQSSQSTGPIAWRRVLPIPETNPSDEAAPHLRHSSLREGHPQLQDQSLIEDTHLPGKKRWGKGGVGGGLHRREQRREQLLHGCTLLGVHEPRRDVAQRPEHKVALARARMRDPQRPRLQRKRDEAAPQKGSECTVGTRVGATVGKGGGGELGALCDGREPRGRGARGGCLRPPRPRKRGC